MTKFNQLYVYISDFPQVLYKDLNILLYFLHKRLNPMKAKNKERPIDTNISECMRAGPVLPSCCHEMRAEVLELAENVAT